MYDDLLARFVRSFQQAIDEEMAAMRERLGSFELPVTNGATLSFDEHGHKYLKPEHELPSGAGGDMEATQKDAMKYLKPTREILDIVKDGQRIEIPYGYDYTKPERPWWIELPGEPRQTFPTLAQYHFWFELQTGVRHPPTAAPNNPR